MGSSYYFKINWSTCTGYVGFEQGGLLTEAIRKHPHTVLLLDEIEKSTSGFNVNFASSYG